jgi:hypothetical protein
MFQFFFLKKNFNINLFFLKKYFINLNVKFHKKISTLGFIVFLVIILQCLSGVIVSFSLVNDSMLIPLSRDEEDINDLYNDDFF